MAIGHNQSTFSYGGSTVGHIVSFDDSGVEREAVSTTAVGDTHRTVRQSSQTSEATVTITVNYDPADTQHAALRSDVVTGLSTDKEMILTHYDGSTDTFSGRPLSFKVLGIAAEDNENLQAEFVIARNTAYVHAAAEGGE